MQLTVYQIATRVKNETKKLCATFVKQKSSDLPPSTPNNNLYINKIQANLKRKIRLSVKPFVKHL
ncbi:hypothetical protein D0T84_17750 [Dysgonomonas sp. 521]|nr:hypothetical protein [Dysgonomonas sp. 521]